ncbi:MAG: DUF1674 domain-containing protein [Pseudomonadota bacterium]
MSAEPNTPGPGDETADERPPLSEAAKRALAEAEARRAAVRAAEGSPAEKGGPKGPEPTRYGDWEKGGIAYDF